MPPVIKLNLHLQINTETEFKVDIDVNKFLSIYFTDNYPSHWGRDFYMK